VEASPLRIGRGGSGVGVGRRGENLRGKKKNSIEHSVPCPTRSTLDIFFIFLSSWKLKKAVSLRPPPTARFARGEGLACGGLMGVLYRSAPATHSACVLVGGLCFAGMSGPDVLTARQA